MTSNFRLKYQDRSPFDLEEEVLSPITGDFDKMVQFAGKGFVSVIEVEKDTCGHCNELHDFYEITVVNTFNNE